MSWTRNMWHLAGDTWNLKPETWHMTPDLKNKIFIFIIFFSGFFCIVASVCTRREIQWLPYAIYFSSHDRFPDCLTFFSFLANSSAKVRTDLRSRRSRRMQQTWGTALTGLCHAVNSHLLVASARHYVPHCVIPCTHLMTSHDSQSWHLMTVSNLAC